MLRSDLPTGLIDPEVFDYQPLLFKVCDSAALGDADDNGVVEFNDISEVLRFTGSTACLKTGDANRDGIVDFSDLTEVLRQYGNSYCAAAGSLAAGDGASLERSSLTGTEAAGQAAAALMSIGDALTTMGYDSIDSFVSAISAMSPEARDAEVRRLGELIDPQ